MPPHIELNRTFWPIGDEEEYDPDTLRAKAQFGLHLMHWSDLLTMMRVVILAEAGAGKTHELRETARRLRRESKAAFFCHIEDLATGGLEKALSEGNGEEVRNWLAGDHAAWFFLDSVDEARLTHHRYFEKALHELAQALGDATSRAYIFITARVSDWMATADLVLVKDTLPPPPRRDTVDPQRVEQDIVTPDAATEVKRAEKGTEDDVQVIQLAPLTADQMRQFAAGQGVQDVAAFMDAITRADADIFAERPQDLLELIAYWNEHGRIGTHAEMIAFNIDKKLVEPHPGRDEARPLAQAKALEGAILLAAALTFTRKNAILLPDRLVDPARTAEALEPKALLRDWDARDMHTLLGRALFDEATYGRVRFHHRSVREYLTARWLLHLLERGRSRRAVEGLLFAHRYGLDVVIPSMQPMAAWLALWDERVRAYILTIAPDILIQHGDPSGLPVDIRAQLLRRFASLNAGRSDTGASFNTASIRRLADPRLATTVLDLLHQHRANEDVRQLLLNIVWQGPIPECAESALSFALDTTMDSHTRLCGIWAVRAAGNQAQKRRLAEAILTNISDWEKQEIGAAIRALFPDALTLDELLTILETVEPPCQYSVNTLDRAMQEVVGACCDGAQQEFLLAGLVRLLEREPYIERPFCEFSQRYAWLLGYAAQLAERIIRKADVQAPRFTDAVLRTIELDAQAQCYSSVYHRLDHSLQDLIGRLPTLRHTLFWRSAERRRTELATEGTRLTEWWQVRPGSPFGLDALVRQFSMADFEVFLRDVRQRPEIDDRLVALTAAFALWRQGGRGRQGRERMWRAVRGESELEAKLHALLHPRPETEEERRYRRSERNFRRRQAERQARQAQARRKWVRRLRHNIDCIRAVDLATVDQVFGDLYSVGQEILRLTNSLTRWGSNRWELLAAECGREVAEAARDGLMAFWRLYEPPLPSEQVTNGVTNGTIIGLIGLAIEARERPGWARALSAQDAQRACRYALCELNGFPEWASDLLSAHPEAFDAVMPRELAWEFERPADVPAPHYMVSALLYGPEPIRERHCPIIQKLLERVEPAHARTLENALSLVLRWNALDRSTFADLARQRYEASHDEGRRLTWLVAWMCVDADGALGSLRAWLNDAEDAGEATRRTIAFCNALMAHHEMRFGSIWRDFERVEILRQLVPLVSRHVRIEEDNIHEGSYEPDARDNAETTRGYLLGRVCDTPGRAAFDTLMAFSRELPHERSRYRMIVLAHRRAAADAEQEAWLAPDIPSFAEHAERAPRSARDLFDLACSRLDDLQLDLEEGDASEAHILSRVDQETELRTWFTNRLRLAARGRYSVPPEEELADATRPDLRIHAPAVDAPVPIELKIADKWSYAELVERLHNQLVGQYLRDARSRFGVFLLVWRGTKKKWRESESGKQFGFGNLLERLEAEAEAILRDRYDLEAIRIVGIDLTKRGTHR